MPIKLSSIKGLMVNKHEMVGSTEYALAFESGFNSCRKEQGQRSIGFNRDKLAEILYKRGIGKILSYSDADAIIATEADIIEVKNDPTT